jgi:hypothetical protein
VSAYKSQNQVVVVFVNNAESQRMELPILRKNQKVNAFVTSQTENLAHWKISTNSIELPAEAIVTVVIAY